MEHIYENVVGWFDFQEIYSRQVKKAKDGDIFIEIGTANGKSAAFMCVEIANSGKQITFHTVDIFPPENEIYHQEENARALLEPFEFCSVHKMDSLEFLDQIKDEIIEFIFLDGDHCYKTISAELKLAFKKIKPGGTLSGHDYLNEYHPGVKKAVDKFTKKSKIIGTSFLIQK